MLRVYNTTTRGTTSSWYRVFGYYADFPVLRLRYGPTRVGVRLIGARG